LLLRGVIAQLVALCLGQDAEECWVAVGDPMAEGKAANEDGDTGEMELKRLKAPTAPTQMK